MPQCGFSGQIDLPQLLGGRKHCDFYPRSPRPMIKELSSSWRGLQVNSSLVMRNIRVISENKKTAQEARGFNLDIKQKLLPIKNRSGRAVFI